MKFFFERIGSFFLSFKTYLFLIPIVILFFSLIFTFAAKDFVVGTTDKGSFYSIAVHDFISDLCKRDGKQYKLSIKEQTCIFKFKKPRLLSNAKSENYTISSIVVSFKEFSDRKIILKYSFNYLFHLRTRHQDVGILEISFRHYEKDNKIILLQAIPYIAYPSSNPLIEIAANSEAFDFSGPYKGLTLLSAEILNIDTDRTSITSSNGWPWFSVKDSPFLERTFNVFFESKPLFKSFHERFLLFTYFSGITLMTVGYGDITPITTFTRVLAITESFFGIVFFGMLSACFFAYLVQLYSRPWKEFEKNLTDIENWNVSREVSSSYDMLYYIPNPDFKIVQVDLDQEFSEPWTEVFPDKKAIPADFLIKYRDTVLYTFRFVFCDGLRGINILPNSITKYKGKNNSLPMHRYFYIIENSFNDKLNNLVQFHFSSALTFQINKFKSEAEAELEIQKSFDSENDFLPCFILGSTDDKFTLVNQK